MFMTLTLRPKRATIYAWRQAPLNQDFLNSLIDVLSGGEGLSPLTAHEVGQRHYFGKNIYHTQDFLVIATTREQDAKTRLKQLGSDETVPSFCTALIEQRFARVGLPIPALEMVFSPRASDSVSGVDVRKVIALAAYLELFHHLDTLCVSGADIEHDQYFASPRIAKSLGLPEVLVEAEKLLRAS